MSELWVDTFKNETGQGAPDFPKGLTVTGVITATSISQTLNGNLTVSGNLGVGGTLTYEDVTNIDSVGLITAKSGIKIGPSAGVAGTFFADGSYITAGIITANTYYGSGANLTGIDATQIVTGNTSVQTVDTGSDGHVKINTEGSERVRVGAAGSVGIGTDDPYSPLSIYGDTAPGTFINITSRTNTIAGIKFGDFDDPEIGAIKYGNGDNSLRFFANGSSEKFRVGSAGQWGIGGGNYGNAGEVLKSGGASAAPTWGSVTSKVLQVKFKESTSTRYNYNSGSWGKVDDSSSGIQEAITPSAVGNTILVQMYLSMSVSDGDYGGVTISVHDGSSYISMMGECGSGSYYAPSTILGDNSRFNEHVRNATGGTLWYPVMLQGRHLTTNTNSHTINLYVRMGNNDFYFGDNGAANNMIIWEIEGDIGN